MNIFRWSGAFFLILIEEIESRLLMKKGILQTDLILLKVPAHKHALLLSDGSFSYRNPQATQRHGHKFHAVQSCLSEKELN